MKKLFAVLLLSLFAFAMPLAAMADCGNCGRIKNIEAYTGHRSTTGGAVAGAVVGGLLGNQVGGGSGKTLATVAGAAGGAYVGKEIAENSEKTKYHVTVRMDNGSIRTVDQSSVKGLEVGSLVRIKNGKAVHQ
jgi:outer membrane lipoprotein SlyB